MQSLAWLSTTERKLILNRVQNTLPAELCSRHWGTPASGNTPGEIPRFYIMDIRGLFLAAGAIRYALSQYDTSVFYRGQRKDWVAQAAIFRGANTVKEIKGREEWLEKAIRVTKPFFDPSSSPEIREALLQHYGMPTRWLDVVDNIQSAAWFAYYNSQPSALDLPGERDDGSGYISVIACPNNRVEFASVFDLRKKPSEWLRPHIQQAWGFRSAKPARDLGRLHPFQICTFIVARPLLRIWSGFDTLGPEVVFPKENEDRGLYYWSRAQEALFKAGLFPPPW